MISIGNRAVGTHRAAYEAFVGTIPDGMCVLHRCDIRACINPDHLWLGTKGDNNTDRKLKGRNDCRQGTNNPQAKLTQKQVTAIKMLTELHIAQHRIAKLFGVSQQHVSAISRGLYWG